MNSNETTRFTVSIPTGQDDLTLDCIEYEGDVGYRVARPDVSNCAGMTFFRLDGYHVVADNEREAAHIAATLASMQIPTHYW